MKERLAAIDRHGQQAYLFAQVDVGIVADPGEIDFFEPEKIHGFAVTVARDEGHHSPEPLFHVLAPVGQQGMLVMHEGRRQADADRRCAGGKQFWAGQSQWQQAENSSPLNHGHLSVSSPTGNHCSRRELTMSPSGNLVTGRYSFLL